MATTNTTPTLVESKASARLLDRRIIALAVMVALHATILLALMPLFSSRLTPEYNQNSFADGYDLLAANLASGHGYRFYPDTALTTTREPGYPIFLAGLILIAGPSFFFVKLSNLVLTIGTAFIVYRLSTRLTPSILPRSGIWALLPYALILFHPAIIVAESRGGVEMLFAFLIVLFLLALVRAVETGGWQRYVIAGLVLGITVQVRSTPMLFPAFFLLYAIFFLRDRKTTVVRIAINCAVMVICMVGVLAPWIVRNYRLTHTFIPASSVVGVSAQAGQYINTHLFQGKPFWLLDREASRERDAVAIRLGLPYKDGQNGYYQTFYKTQDELTFSKYLMGQVVAGYKNSPVLFARVLGQNLLNFWVAGKTWKATLLNTILQAPLLLFVAMGSLQIFTSRNTAVGGILLAFTLYVVAVHVPILAQARYSVPLIPLLALIATAGCAKLAGAKINAAAA